MLTCSVDGCQDRRYGRGLCQHHYGRAHRSGELGFRECLTPECDRNAVSKGYCARHFIKLYYSGALIEDDPRFKRMKKSMDHFLVYGIWRSMRNRCFSDKNKDYKNYGGRGITICSGLLDFTNFTKILGIRTAPGLSLDRMNNELHYSCGECDMCKLNGWILNIHWATSSEQNTNKRNVTRLRAAEKMIGVNGHGTWAMYATRKCRCDVCRAFFNRYVRGRRAALRLSKQT